MTGTSSDSVNQEYFTDYVRLWRFGAFELHWYTFLPCLLCLKFVEPGCSTVLVTLLP